MNNNFKSVIGLLCGLFILSASSFARSNRSFTLFQMNVWVAGNNVPDGHNSIINVLSEVDADVVFLCEIEGDKTISKIVEELDARGIHYYGISHNLNVGILSKTKPDSTIACCTVPGNEYRTMLRAVIRIDGEPIAFYSAHLDHQNYGCYLPRGYSGATWQPLMHAVTNEEEVLKANRLAYRDESIRLFLQHIQSDLQQGTPVIIGGDFNEPSHLDWQADTKMLRDHHGAIVNWDCSVLLHNAGFIDSYRKKYPDPVRNPGITYPAGNRAALQANLSALTFAPTADERDRIDFIYYHPGNNIISLRNSIIVGPSETVAYNKIVDNDSKDRFFTPRSTWPSDHKANLATFKVKKQR